MRADQQTGFVVREDHFETVTVNSSTGLRVGLHVDNWSGLEQGHRDKAPIRICANFGWSDRFLLFVDTPLDFLLNERIEEFLPWQATLGPNEANRITRPTLLAREFLKAFPRYPIFRLRIKPGEAYLAPTENIIHDGSTIIGSGLDIACHIRG
jgi:hypothetical protein